MKLVLKDGTEIIAAHYSYGMSASTKAIDSGETTDPQASINIDIPDDADIQRLVNAYITQFSTDNISDITVTSDSGIPRKYTFTKCTSCQVITSTNREYVYVTLV